MYSKRKKFIRNNKDKFLEWMRRRLYLIKCRTNHGITFTHSDKPDVTIQFSKANNSSLAIQIIDEFKKELTGKIFKPIKPDYKTYINSDEWKIKSKQCILESGKRCEVCGSGFRLQAHHYNYKNLGHEHRDDLFCLCRSCHQCYHLVKRSGMLPKDNLVIKSSGKTICKLTRSERLNHIKEIVKHSHLIRKTERIQ